MPKRKLHFISGYGNTQTKKSRTISRCPPGKAACGLTICLRAGLAAAVFRRSAMVDPKGAARRSGCAGSTGLHLPSGRACKGVVYFELSFAWRNRRAIAAGDRWHGTYTHGHPYCGSFLPYGRDLYQPACGSVCGGVALCAGTRISACCAAPRRAFGGAKSVTLEYCL